VMLRVRVADGLPLAVLDGYGRAAAAEALAKGLLELRPYEKGSIVLTLKGRLLADAVVRDLLP